MAELDAPRCCIAIAGGTCAGKSWLSDIVSQEYSGRTCVIREEDFYPDRSAFAPSQLADINFDSIHSLDVELLLLSLTTLIAGQVATVPRYDPRAHRRLDHWEQVSPASVLVVEGMHAISIAESLCDRSDCECDWIRVFVECSDRKRMSRRLARELWSPTIPGDFDEYWRAYCAPMFEREVLPQRQRADLPLGSPPRRHELNKVLEMIRGKLSD